MLMDKRHVYDWDTRIHLLARGPGIDAGSTFAQPATQVDLAPTFLDIAGLKKPANMDGHSLLPLLTNGRRGTGKGAAALRGGAPWRDAVFIEYYYVSPNDKCVTNCSKTTKNCGPYPQRDTQCVELPENAECWSPLCTETCYPTESPANNFIGLRHPSRDSQPFGDSLYAEFATGDQSKVSINFAPPDFVEIYNATRDPWMMNNLRGTLDAKTRAALHDELHAWFRCAGEACP